MNISLRTWRRWQKSTEDRRLTVVRKSPANRLSPEEEQRILEICHQPEYAELPPSQIVPRLADQGVYVASESTFYRVLSRCGEVHHRGRQRKPRKVKPPTTFKAEGPCQVWSWDITWLPSSGFESLEEVRAWVTDFIHWYNDEHRHSGISYVTPSQRHKGEDVELLAARDQVYRAAREAKPERWSKQTRNWQRKDAVMLNPEKEKLAA